MIIKKKIIKFITGVGACLFLSVAANTFASTQEDNVTGVSRTEWQMNRGDSWKHLGFRLSSHGHKDAYIKAVVPAESDTRWVTAPNPDTIGFSERSILPGYCLQAVDYTYFQTFVTVPVNGTVDTFKISFSGIDDGGRVTIYNDQNPDGVVVEGSYVYLGGSGTSDLAEYMVTGENRVVVTQVDDCPVGNNLHKAEVVLNGSVVVVNTPPNAVARVVSDNPLECTGSLTSVTLDGSYSTDADGDALSYAWAHPMGSASGITPLIDAPIGSHSAILTVNDGNGGIDSDAAQFSIVDTTSPTVNAGVDVVLEASSAAGAAYTVVPTGSDLCSAVSYHIAPSPAVYPLGTTVVNVVGTDSSGNQAADSVNVTVKDTTAPSIIAELQRKRGGDDGAVYKIVFAATDVVTPNPIIRAVLEIPGCRAIRVRNGQRFSFEREDDDEGDDDDDDNECEVEYDDGMLEIEGSSVTLVVTATDAAGNVSVIRVAPAAHKKRKERD